MLAAHAPPPCLCIAFAIQVPKECQGVFSADEGHACLLILMFFDAASLYPLVDTQKQACFQTCGHDADPYMHRSMHTMSGVKVKKQCKTHLPFLPYPVCPSLSLQVYLWVPISVIHDDSVCCLQVETHSASPYAQQEDVDVAACTANDNIA